MIFLSKILELRLVMKPRWVTQDPATGVIVHPGHTIEFAGGRYETDDEEEIEYIKSRPGFGSKITSIEKGDIAPGPSVLTGAVGTGPDTQKRTFKCIRCGVDGFESGFEIARHRKSGECDRIIAESKREAEEPVTPGSLGAKPNPEETAIATGLPEETADPKALSFPTLEESLKGQPELEEEVW